MVVDEAITIHILVFQVTRLDGTTELGLRGPLLQGEFACIGIPVEVIFGVESQTVVAPQGIKGLTLGVLVGCRRIHGLIKLLPLGREISADDAQCSIDLAQLLLRCHAEVQSLAVLNVVVDGRHERAATHTALQVRGEGSQVLNNETVHIRVEVGQVKGKQLLEERATQTHGVFLAMDEVENRVATLGGQGDVGGGAFVPAEVAAVLGLVPCGLIVVVVVLISILHHIDINILAEVAVGSTEHEVIHERVFQEILPGQVPADGE